MKLLKDNVLIEPDKVKKVSDIIDLPDDSQIKPKPRGTVLAVGPDVTDVAVGDIVHFETFDWTKAPHGRIILRESEILAVERSSAGKKTAGVDDFRRYING